MKKHSAGMIAYRINNGQLEVLMAHMGAPWWVKKDDGAWSIPKGGIQKGEEPFEAAKREFKEELGLEVPLGDFIDLGEVNQHNSKTVAAWAIKADIDASEIKSNTFKTEWPPRSGKVQEFPEIDRAAWMTVAIAAKKCVRGQAELFDRLAIKLGEKLETNVAINEPGQQSLL